MLFLKSFFRKKSTIIYLIIHSIIIAAIISIFSLINYNKEIINNIFKKNSYILLSSENDYYDEISKYKSITKIERILLFYPDNKYDTFGNLGYSSTINGINIESDGSEENERKLNWEEYTSSTNGYIKIMSDENKDFKLKENEIALSEIPFKSELYNALIGKNISFKYNNNEIDFVINGHYKSGTPEMTIAKEKFDTLTNNKTYSYKIYVNSPEEASKINKELEQLENNKSFFVDYNYVINGNEDSESNSAAIDLLYVLELVYYAVIIVFIFVIIVVSKNILSDEYKNFKIQRMLGYSKNQARKYTIMKFLVFDVIALVIGSIISIIVINICINLIL